jgi:hypothetical protein
MAKFLYIFRGGAAATPALSAADLQAHLAKWYSWSEDLSRAGRQNVGHPLERDGKSIRGDARVLTDGPYAESKDLVTGALVLEAASLDEATELARSCPIFELGGSVEIRPVVGPGKSNECPTLPPR